MDVRQVYFHTTTEAEANLCIETCPLTVNCTGTGRFRAPFRRTDSRKDYGIVYVTNGEMYFRAEGRKIILKEGEFLVGKPQQQNEYGSDCECLDYYWLQFTGSDVEKLIKEMNLNYRTPYFIGVQHDMIALFEEIFKEFQFNDRLFDLRAGARLTLLLSQVICKLERTNRTYLRSLDYIHKHYNEELSIQQLAEIEGYSRSYYQTSFRRNLGISPQNYIIRQRIDAACYYLKNSAHSVAEIANMIGYSDPYYFSRIFKKNIGCSPLQYRKNQKV